MNKQILQVVNEHALSGGIGTVIGYLNEGINQRGGYSSSVLKTNADDLGRNGMELVQRAGSRFDDFINSSHFLEQELEQYDIIHIHGVPSYRVLEAIDVLKERGTCPKLVATCHSSAKQELLTQLEKAKGTPDEIEISKMVENGLANCPIKFADTFWGSLIYRQEKVMTLADRVQHMSKTYRDQIINEFSAQENRYKHCIVYNGIELVPDDKLAPRPHKKRILYSGRLAIEKGSIELIEALPGIFSAHPDTEIKIMGGDKEGVIVEQYKRKTAELLHQHFNPAQAEQLLQRVHFTGWLTDKDEIAANYDWCDFLIAPSVSESFCLAIAEALNHQRIPIMTNTPALRELYLSRGVGFGIEPDKRNGKGIARAINAALYADEAYPGSTKAMVHVNRCRRFTGCRLDETYSRGIKAMAQLGRELVKDNYSLEKVIEEQLKVYADLFN